MIPTAEKVKIFLVQSLWKGDLEQNKIPSYLFVYCKYKYVGFVWEQKEFLTFQSLIKIFFEKKYLNQYHKGCK